MWEPGRNGPERGRPRGLGRQVGGRACPPRARELPRTGPRSLRWRTRRKWGPNLAGPGGAAGPEAKFAFLQVHVHRESFQCEGPGPAARPSGARPTPRPRGSCHRSSSGACGPPPRVPAPPARATRAPRTRDCAHRRTLNPEVRPRLGTVPGLEVGGKPAPPDTQAHLEPRL